MSTLHVICHIGDSEYALAADDVFQMDNYSEATAVPGAPSYVSGLVQIRQRIIPLLNARLRFGLPAAEPTRDTRIVVVKVLDRLVGILVDSAREVQNISADQFKSPPDVISNQSAGFVKSIAQIKNRIIILLDMPKVIGEEVTRG